MAKVSELIEQARALEAQGESAKALAIYQHVLPHLEGMPAIKADLALKAGDLMLKTGNQSGALKMYQTAGSECALHGSSKGALTVAAKILNAAPERNDVYLSLAGQMVKHGHAGPAVDVLIQHAKHANLQQMLQELEPLAGRPSEDVLPLVQMLLDTPAGSPPPPAPVEAPPSPPRSRSSREVKAPPATDELRLQTTSMEDELASIPQPAAPLPRVSTPSLEPPAPLPPPPPLPDSGLQTDVSPPTPRETAAINLRASQVGRAIDAEPPAEKKAERSPTSSTIPPVSRERRATAPPRKRSGGGAVKWVVILVLLAGAGAVYYFNLLPAGLLDQVKTRIAGIRAGSTPRQDSVRPSTPTPTPQPAATPRRDTAPRPGLGFPGAPPVVRGAPAAAPTEQIGRQPPVRIQGLAITDFAETPSQFRVVQRQESGQYLVLTGKPLADTVGEPAVGEVRLDSLPGDTAVAITNFDGYLLTVRGVIAPAALQALLLQLVSRSSR